MDEARALATKLRDEAQRLGGSSLTNGCAGCGIAANVAEKWVRHEDAAAALAAEKARGDGLLAERNAISADMHVLRGKLESAEAQRDTLKTAAAAVVAAAAEFRAGMTPEWDGDPLSDACEALDAALASIQTPGEER
jgi:hypothetical protein